LDHPTAGDFLIDDVGVMHSVEFVFLNVAVITAITCLYIAYHYFLLRKRIRLGIYGDVPVALVE